jgi:hypothetical protein
MKKGAIVTISLLLAGIVSVKPASVQAASMAVLVVGLETDAASDAFAQSIRYEYAQKGYTMVDNDAVKTKLAALRQAYKNGQPVDTVGLAAWGRENSLDFVQLVVEKGIDLTISGREQLGQVATCGIAKFGGRSYYRMRFAAQGSMPCECEYECEETNGEFVRDVLGMVRITGGVFQLATNYYVQLSDFYIGKYEVTQRLWKTVMGTNPSVFKGDDLPLEGVIWADIVGAGGFLETLNAKTGMNFRLPTDAEWQYAARGCNAGVCDTFVYSGSDTVNNVAWYDGNNSGATHAVGTKSANGLDLYDMSGNVWEWCYDWQGSYPSNTSSTPAVNPTGAASGPYRVIRGGCWSQAASGCRVINPPATGPAGRNYNKGFRLV